MLFGKSCPDEGSSTVQSSLHWDPSCHRDLSSFLRDSSCPLLSPQWLTAAVTGQCVGRVQGWCRCQWQLDLVKRCRLRWCLCLPDTSPTPGSRFWSTCLTPQECSTSQTPVCSPVGFVNCWLFEEKREKKVHSDKRWNGKLKLNPLLNVLRQLHGERQFVPAGWPGGHGKHPQPGQCALCGQQRPSAEGDSHATVGLVRPRRGVQPQPHAAGPGATCHRWPHHGGQRHMMSPVRRCTRTLNGLRCSLGAWVPESLADTAVSYQYGSHYWRRYKITD